MNVFTGTGERDHSFTLHSAPASAAPSASLSTSATSSVTKPSPASSTSATTTSSASTSRSSTTSSLAGDVLLHHVYDLVRDSEVLDGAAPDVTLGHPPELVPVPTSADHSFTLHSAPAS